MARSGSPRRRSLVAVVCASTLLALVPIIARAQVTGCPPYSQLNCAQVSESVPFALTFDGTEGGLLDDAAGGAVGTGFTMVQPRSAAGDPYLPENLHVANGELRITTTPGLQYRVPGQTTGSVNSLDNGLGVGIDPGTHALRIQTTIIAPPSGSGKGQQAGIWFGPDEDNYVKLVILSASATKVKVQLSVEQGGGNAGDPAQAPPELNSATFAPAGSTIALILTLDPVTGQAVGSYQIDNGAEQVLPAPGALSFPASFFSNQAIANAVPGATTTAGVFATHRNGANPLQYRFGGLLHRRRHGPHGAGGSRPACRRPPATGRSPWIGTTTASSISAATTCTGR